MAVILKKEEEKKEKTKPDEQRVVCFKGALNDVSFE